jgi:hypothetical protein
MSNFARKLHRAGDGVMLDPNRLTAEREAIAALERQQQSNENLVCAQIAAQVACSQFAPDDAKQAAAALLRRVFDWGFDAAHGTHEASP